MLDESLKQWRRQRLQELRKLPDFGNQGALARALGLADGSYIGQMERGERAITEKTIAQIEALRGGKFAGWFSPPNASRPLTARALRVAELFDLIEPDMRGHVEALVQALQPIIPPEPPSDATTAARGPHRETPA